MTFLPYWQTTTLKSFYLGKSDLWFDNTEITRNSHRILLKPQQEGCTTCRAEGGRMGHACKDKALRPAAEYQDTGLRVRT